MSFTIPYTFLPRTTTSIPAVLRGVSHTTCPQQTAVALGFTLCFRVHRSDQRAVPDVHRRGGGTEPRH